MSTSNPTYKDYSFQNHSEVYKLLEQIFSNYGITYYLIGANARDVHLYKSGIKPIRATADIDFAIMVPDFVSYSALITELCTMGFSHVVEPYRIVYDKTNTILDLMPYGEIEEAYTVNFTERAVSLSVLGFKEVGEYIQYIDIPEEGYSLPVTPIEGMFILKLLAWNDKPSFRTKDLDDLSFLLKHAWDIYEEEAYAEHLEVFDDEQFDTQTAAAKIIGKKMGLILAENEILNQTIVAILKEAIKDDGKAKNPELAVAQYLDITIEKAKNILTYLLAGINQNRI
ncbi:nucleotidyl transferase AbiEii/AbiGii toxin family protein [Gelidibacter japonicus]|uniref:nucleotidyl transferase AbiEii/AbiGii toxin family protein n=1 Tax=Gelidibacter japonicus TaxID=1962232 RepID=UPI00202230C4|nr:nucleotidyl transferase AbiEii/AbiGii toxin family protein [Gelidibacter japonicus]MCL8008642.1 nucleotidyl transferase AbiEii/AbiGii toxin family protein [Gelidibacter japonicus]